MKPQHVTKMATVRAPQIRVQKKTSNRFLLLLVKILLVLVILLLLPKLVKARSKLNYRNKKQRRHAEVVLNDARMSCEMNACVHFIPEEAMNCVQLCLSPACYQKVYGDEPLEDGEIDVDRAKTFEVCVKEEMRLARKLQRSDPALFGQR